MTRGAKLFFNAAIALAAAGCGSSSAVSPSSTPPDGLHSATASASSVVATQPASSAAGDAGVLSVLSVEHQVDVATDRDGVVVSIEHDQGSMVSKGEILGQLDDRTLQIQMVKARDDLQVAQNNVKYKEAELRAKSAALQRQQQLLALGLSSQADLETADFEAKAAEYDLQGYQAMAESGQAEIHRLEIEIDKTRLRAPFSGAIVTRYVREGQEVTKGDKCFRVSQLAPLQVQFQVPESAAQRPKQGSFVSLVLVSDPTRSLRARIVKISPVIDPASDSYNVTAELGDRGISDLRPGMAVRVAVPSAARPAP